MGQTLQRMLGAETALSTTPYICNVDITSRPAYRVIDALRALDRERIRPRTRVGHGRLPGHGSPAVGLARRLYASRLPIGGGSPTLDGEEPFWVPYVVEGHMEGNLHLPRLPAGARLTAGMRTLLLFALLLVCLANPTDLTAQTEADRESVNRVVEWLFLNAGEFGNEVARHPGIWSVVIGRFAKGDSREIEIPAKAGEWYQVEGGSDSDGTEVDICVYDPEGGRIECDTMEDNYPIVGFIAEMEGDYRAVLTAASVEGGATTFAGMVVFRVLDDGEDGTGGGK